MMFFLQLAPTVIILGLLQTIVQHYSRQFIDVTLREDITIMMVYYGSVAVISLIIAIVLWRTA